MKGVEVGKGAGISRKVFAVPTSYFFEVERQNQKGIYIDRGTE